MNVNFIFKKVKCLVAFLCFLVTISLQAQNARVSGKVMNSKKEALQGATIFIPELSKRFSTNLSGAFKVDLPKGNYTFEFSYVGFKKAIKKVISRTSNLTIVLERKETILEEVLVSAVRVKSNSPITFSNFDKKEISKRNLGQDIPVLMNYLPSVVTTSDAGAGIGYTGIRVRGSDATRVNVTINGIPYNDSESHGTYWVNMPDFASSTESIQLQRGVGTSTNGAGAFGASLNVLTDSGSENAFAEIATSFGSYGTQKYTAKAGTGKLNNHFNFVGRISKVKSDGYIDRASSNLESYFLQGSYTDKNTLLKALVFGGHEITYQSWNGIDGETMKKDRTFNSAGAKYNTNGEINGYYSNEVDNYKQDHMQLHWNQQFLDSWSSNIALHYTYGRGYYEQYKQALAYDANWNVTGALPIDQQDKDNTDYIRRKWLNNDFYGVTYNINYTDENWDVLFGGAWNQYKGDHYGKVIWARYASDELGSNYYNDYGNKEEFNLFTKVSYKLDDKLSLFVDLQNRNVNYQADGVQDTLVDDTFNFFNPKAGVTYAFNQANTSYFSYAKAQREPNRSDYKNGNPRPEKLDDFELGHRYISENVSLNTNVYYMFYTDQLALTGEIDSTVGTPIRANIGESYRLGLEVEANVKISDKLSISPNFTLSKNKNIDFKEENENGEVTHLGDKDISYSPNVIVGNSITFSPLENINISLLSKYVGAQFMSNNEFKKSKLTAYFVSDLSVNYTIKPKTLFKSVILTAMVNNVFNEEYSSNGYMWGTTAYYYPQAPTNFLLGATLRF